MEVLDEIIYWASGLPLWQQVAVVSILNNRCDEAQVQAIADICIREHQNPDELLEEFDDPLKDFKYDPGNKAEDGVVVTGIHSTQNINAIRDGSKITFGESGLNIVYGSNAVGKSGYSRIFKAACMCRDNERVHGDIGRQDVIDPSAVITFKNGESSEEYTWSNAADPSAPLNTVHIFDSRTARIQLTEKNDVKYVPSGLDIFDKLADVFMAVREQVEHQISHCDNNSPSFDLIFSDYADTPAYAYLADLSDKENIERVRQVIGLNPEQEKELEQLQKEIRAKEANHPSKRQETLRQKRLRFARLHNQINSYQRKLQQSDYDEIHKLKQAYLDAQKIADIAKDKQFDNTNLSGTGGTLWKMLWSAAEDFSKQEAYHEHEFPYTGAGAVCVLCQQPLAESAQTRFKSFKNFINDKSQELLKTAKQNYDVKILELKDIELHGDQETFEAIFEELVTDEYDDANNLKRLLANCQKMYQDALTHSTDMETDAKFHVPEVDYQPRGILRELINAMDQESKSFDIAKFTNILNKQKLRSRIFESMQLLKKHEKQINKEIANLERRAMLKKCLSETDTKGISRKGGELANKYLGDNLKNTYDQQLKELNRKGLIVELRKAHVVRGTTFSEIVITTASGDIQGRYKPDEIMSESEQKIASLAGFFTELSIAPHKSAIIFDDPVTSLDELNTARIAKRIVKEAELRQVIVFTHNLFFTTELINFAEYNGVHMTARTVSKAAYTGHVQDDLPWRALSTSKRIKSLRAKHQDLAAMYRRDEPTQYGESVKNFYGKMRETWERAVEEILFNGVVKRYNRAVETQKLKKVNILDSDKETVEENMTHCSYYSHDPPDNVDSVETPEPNQLAEDLEKLSNWIKEVEARQR